MTFILIKILMWELSMLYCHSFYNYIVFLVESYLYVFFIVSFYMCCRWRSNYQEARYMFPLTSSTPPHLCACTKPEPAFPMSLSSFQWVNMIGDCSICWYCSNCLIFHFIVTLDAHCTPWSPKVTNYCLYNEIMSIFS
jgi:hypothetical protein